MANDNFNHGTSVTQSAEDIVLISASDTSIIGVLGTAPDANATDWPINTPTLITLATQAATLGDAGTLKDNLDTIFDFGTAQVVVVRIEEGASAAELLANAIGDQTTLTGIHAWKKSAGLGLPIPKLLHAPGIAKATPADGVASVAVTVAGSDYDVDTKLAITGDTGSGAVISPIIGAGGAIEGVAIVNPGYGYTGNLVVTISDEGAGAGATFSATIGQVLNPLVAEAIGVTETLGAQYYADGPDSTDQAAVQARAVIGSKNICFCDPRSLKSIDGITVPMPSSSIFVGQQSRIDKLYGPHYPASNYPINGIIGTNRAVVPGEQSNYLNVNQVNTIVNHGDGFRTWGPWTCSQKSVWQFVNVVRTSQAVNDGLKIAFLEFVDRPMTMANIDQMIWSGRQYLKNLENLGWLLPGSIFKLSDANSPTTGANGIISYYMAFEVPAPMSDIRVDAHRNIQIGYTLLFSAVAGVESFTEIAV